MGYHGEPCALSFRDVGINWLEIWGLKNKEGPTAKRCLRYIAGDDTVFETMYTDGSKELEVACGEGVAAIHDTSVPGNSQNNARIERSNRHCLEAIRTMLWQSGLPL